MLPRLLYIIAQSKSWSCSKASGTLDSLEPNVKASNFYNLFYTNEIPYYEYFTDISNRKYSFFVH